jgi:dTDP-4-dehydrorhamnose reductase
MRLIIAGWHGQLARALTEEALAAPDIAALAVGRPSLDVRDPRSIERVFGDVRPDLVINTAAYTAVDEAEAEPDRAMALNRDGARQLASAAARRGVPIIHLSTHYVFDGTKSAPYVETDATNPQTAYGRSKLEGENAVREANPQHVIARTGWVYSGEGRNFFTRVAELAATSREPLSMVADQQGNPTFAPHLATVILALARQALRRKSDDSVWGTYHAAGTGTASWYEAAREILAALERNGGPRTAVEPVTSDKYQAKAARPANCALDCSKLERTFGLALPDWQEGIAACAAKRVRG